MQLRREDGLFPEADPEANSYILTGNPILSACREETLASLLDTIGGSLLVERFFSVPGMGTFLADAISKYDVNVVQTLTLLYATLGVLGTFLGDVLMTLVDPRITLQRKEESR